MSWKTTFCCFHVHDHKSLPVKCLERCAISEGGMATTIPQLSKFGGKNMAWPHSPPKTNHPISHLWDALHSVYGLCISLNESTSYLLLCVLMNFFCTERKNLNCSKSWDQVCDVNERQGFKSQSEFWLHFSPYPHVQAPMWVAIFRPTELHIWLSGNFSSDINTANFVYAFSSSPCLSCILESLRS